MTVAFNDGASLSVAVPGVAFNHAPPGGVEAVTVQFNNETPLSIGAGDLLSVNGAGLLMTDGGDSIAIG